MESSLGTIIYFLPERGYGFLRLHGTREEFHFRAGGARVPVFRAGQLVRFTLQRTGRGWEAVNVVPAGMA